MPFDKIKGLDTYYEVHGEGETIILLHHGFGCTKMWKDIYPRLELQGYKVVTYDRRGFGQSEKGTEWKAFYESDRYRPESVEELKAIKERLAIDECYLVGQCEGGVLAIDYSIQYPNEVKSLVVGSTQCYSEVTMAELNALQFPKKFKYLDPQLQAKMVDWHGTAAEVNFDQFTTYGGAYGVDHFDLRPILPLVPCPALVLYPDRSALFGVEQAVAFFRGLPKGELAVFPKCGHNTYEQRPEDYARTVLDFIARSRGGEDSRVRPGMTCLA